MTAVQTKYENVEEDPRFELIGTHIDPETGEQYTIGLSHSLDKTGDTRALWDSRNEEEVSAAKKQWDELVTKSKYFAYRAKGKKGEQGEKMTEWDPTAERIIYVKQNVGG